MHNGTFIIILGVDSNKGGVTSSVDVEFEKPKSGNERSPSRSDSSTVPSLPLHFPMVFNLSNSSSDDGETPALTPVASPRACSGCVGVIRRFDGPGLQDRSRDGGAVGQIRYENPLGSNDSAGKVYRQLVVKVELHDDRDRRKAMLVIASFEGIGSLSMDSRDNKLTVSGDFDPVKVVNKLRKSWHTEIVSVGAAREDDGKKDEGKKEEGKKDDQVANLVKAYQAYYSTPVTYYHVSPEETPNCVIC